MNKTIDINPALFSMGGLSKTKKNRDKKQKPINVPLISPNILKNKLLKRIKEHKKKETENLDNKKNSHEKDGKNNSGDSKIPQTSVLSYNDEFNDSINYLQTLSKEKKIKDDKQKMERERIKKKEELDKKTIKNYHSMNDENTSMPYINLELPDELKESFINITENENINTNIKLSSHTEPSLKLNVNNDNIPYGILKGGAKPTYRNWMKTQKTHPTTTPLQYYNTEKPKNERETILNTIKEKIKQKQYNQTRVVTNDDIMMTTNLIQKPTTENISYSSITNTNTTLNSYDNTNTTLNSYDNTNTTLNVSDNTNNIIPSKKIITKTIRRKYTLGKSNIKRTVAVLLKDRRTRKNILISHKDLKKKPMNEIKLYLRDHNLIKIGSNAPNDVIRKLYESAVLAGEITNKNKETLLHNFIKDDSDL